MRTAAYICNDMGIYNCLVTTTTTAFCTHDNCKKWEDSHHVFFIFLGRVFLEKSTSELIKLETYLLEISQTISNARFDGRNTEYFWSYCGHRTDACYE